MKLKLKMSMKILAVVKKCLILVIIRLSQNKLVFGKKEKETGNAAIEKFVGLKRKMYSFSVDNNEHQKAKSVNRNVDATISHNE